MNTELMFSSKTDLWATPQEFFDNLHKEFSFTLDPCATYFNTKCDKWYGYEFDFNEFEKLYHNGLNLQG